MGLANSHDNIRFSLPHGCVFSIASLNGRKEVALINASGGFIPVHEWYTPVRAPHGSIPVDADVLPLDGSAIELSRVLYFATFWAGSKRGGTQVVDSLHHG